jgi:broad specificity phosphatase PhoE
MTDSTRCDLYLVRHGETAWSVTGQHTGRTDLPLTSRGEAQARTLQARLNGQGFARVFSSPLKRAARTCELAGFGSVASLDPELVEWDYGDYEGRTLAQIQGERPGWDLFRHGCPRGESVRQITERVDRVLSRVRAIEGPLLFFSSGHVLRVLAARWLETAAELGRGLQLDPASICVLGYDHKGADRVIRLWNDASREVDRCA